jgi:hypothetical protein
LTDSVRPQKNPGVEAPGRLHRRPLWDTWKPYLFTILIAGRFLVNELAVVKSLFHCFMGHVATTAKTLTNSGAIKWSNQIQTLTIAS